MLVDIIKSVLFGIVEGITEWLPISSTGHMILLDEFVKLSDNEAFMEMFNVVIQLGAILAVVILYFRKLWPFQSPKAQGGIIKRESFRLWMKVIVASIPAMAIGLPFDDAIDALFFNPQTSTLRLLLPLFPIALTLAWCRARMYRAVLLGCLVLFQVVWVGFLWHFTPPADLPP